MSNNRNIIYYLDEIKKLDPELAISFAHFLNENLIKIGAIKERNLNQIIDYCKEEGNALLPEVCETLSYISYLATRDTTQNGF